MPIIFQLDFVLLVYYHYQKLYRFRKHELFLLYSKAYFMRGVKGRKFKILRNKLGVLNGNKSRTQ